MNQPNIGTYAPGTLLTVGSHQCKVLKYLTSGGYAQVYSAEMYPTDAYAESNVVCLKRVIVPDKASLNTLRAEVDAMKLLKNRKHVVSYIDSHAAKSILQDGSYEVFLLMEYCAGGGLIDFMNTRLQNRLQEFEILNILNQVAQGIAAMHALMPPLIHRDIKIENVLISQKGEYKVCDFGSVCGVIRPPKNPQELAYVQHDIMKSTTAQYRAPEMIDLYRGFPIDEKSDIWALGVFLYKLCYYTTPFEKGGELAILHSKFEFPAQPIYSDRMKNLIQTMLMESPAQRPNICQALEEVARMQGVPCPIRNFYLLRAMEQANTNNNLNYQLHYSKTQPILSTIDMPIADTRHLSMVPVVQAGGPSSRQMTPSNTLPNFTPVVQASETIANNQINELKNHLQTINKGMIPGKQNYGLQKLKSAPSNISIRSASPEKNGRGKIGQIVDTNPTLFDRRTLYVDSDTQTLDLTPPSNSNVSEVIPHSNYFASSPAIKTEIAPHAHSSSSRSSTIAPEVIPKASGRSASPSPLAKASRGGLLVNQTNGSFPSSHLSAEMNQNIIESSEGSYREDQGLDKSSKKAIQKRVQDLLQFSSDSSSPATDLQRDGPKKTESKLNKVHGKPTGGKVKSKPPPLPPKPAHLRPKKPAKPLFLSSAKTRNESHDSLAVMDTKVERMTRDVRKEISSNIT